MDYTMQQYAGSYNAYNKNKIKPRVVIDKNATILGSGSNVAFLMRRIQFIFESTQICFVQHAFQTSNIIV